MEAYASYRTQWDIFHALEDELTRQGRFSNQAFGEFNKGVQTQGAESANSQMQTGHDQRMKMYADAYATPLSVGGPHSPQGAVDKANYDLLANRRANLGAYGDWATQQDVSNIRQGEKLENIYQKSASEARIYPYRQWKAQHGWDQLQGMGQMLQGSGGVGSMFNQGQSEPASNPNAGQPEQMYSHYIMGGQQPNYQDYFYQDPSWNPGVQGGYDYQDTTVNLPSYG